MRRFALNTSDTLKTPAAAYACCQCPWVCSCNVEDEPWILNS